jgi:uncharacterized protein (TIGR00255 family)
MVKTDNAHRTISMTGFAARTGSGAGYDWAWDIRSVNGKGLDLRLRLPDGIDGLEAEVRSAVGRVAARGNVSLGLKLSRQEGVDALRVSPTGLLAAINALIHVEEAARDRGLELRHTTAADLLTMRGVIEQGAAPLNDTGALKALLIADLDDLLADFMEMRAAEGTQIGAVLAGQIERIETLTEAAAEAAEARRPETAANLQANLARVLDGAPGADPARVAQELALLAVKADITEEIDRLRAHIKAARTLLLDIAPVGRKFEFLTQEFVREANTLCSKSGAARLTAIGLDLKHVIDQMREQIQNVE